MAAAEKKSRRDVHLLIDAEALRSAKIECAKAEIDLGRATEELYRLWSSGKVRIDLPHSSQKPKR